jgi:hypothetical protein
MTTERIQRQIGRLLDEAEEAVARLDWATVRQRAQAVLALDPNNGDGLALLAASERALGGGASSSQAALHTQVGAGLKPAPTPAPQPASFADGRYVVKRFLGEGGKKKVFLAHDTLLDRDVAFAIIKTEGLDDTARTRITREAQAMGRLGPHPHIVTVFDLGQEEGRGGFQTRPYMVTELMGQLDTSAQHFEDALSFCRRAGYRPELAWSLFDYADMLLQRDGPSDRQKATSLLDESLKISRELGMRPLMERVLSRRKILRA